LHEIKKRRYPVAENARGDESVLTSRTMVIQRSAEGMKNDGNRNPEKKMKKEGLWDTQPYIIPFGNSRAAVYTCS